MSVVTTEGTEERGDHEGTDECGNHGGVQLRTPLVDHGMQEGLRVAAGGGAGGFRRGMRIHIPTTLTLDRKPTARETLQTQAGPICPLVLVATGRPARRDPPASSCLFPPASWLPQQAWPPLPWALACSPLFPDIPRAPSSASSWSVTRRP